MMDKVFPKKGLVKIDAIAKPSPPRKQAVFSPIQILLSGLDPMQRLDHLRQAGDLAIGLRCL